MFKEVSIMEDNKDINLIVFSKNNQVFAKKRNRF